jgi:ABC-type phosphate transport system substrate-binding protein
MWNKYLPLILLLVLPAGFAVAQDKGADLAIVVNVASTLDNISSAELAKIFKAERTRTPDGVKYVLAMRETGSPERNAALRVIYQMTDAEYERYFLQATFAGTIQSSPKQFSSDSAVRQFVAGSPGAISYLRASDVDSSVKVLKIDGKSPGDPDYPIKIK